MIAREERKVRKGKISYAESVTASAGVTAAGLTNLALGTAAGGTARAWATTSSGTIGESTAELAIDGRRDTRVSDYDITYRDLSFVSDHTPTPGAALTLAVSPTEARYIKLINRRRATGYGVKLRDFSLWGATGTPSGIEGFGEDGFHSPATICRPDDTMVASGAMEMPTLLPGIYIVKTASGARKIFRR